MTRPPADRTSPALQVAVTGVALAVVLFVLYVVGTWLTGVVHHLTSELDAAKGGASSITATH